MVDKKARQLASVMLRRLALGRMTSFEFEEQFPTSDDHIIHALYNTVLGFCDDSREHTFRGCFSRGSNARGRLLRWLLFLKTDLDYKWPTGVRSPGARDYYKGGCISKILGIAALVEGRTAAFQKHGDYSVWPFLTVEEYSAARDRLYRKTCTTSNE